MPPGPTIETARKLLSAGRPFSAHEVFEARWKDGPEEERDLWQGLAQLCVGTTHCERGNLVGAQRLWERAHQRLTGYAVSGGPTYRLQLDPILEWLEDRLREAADSTLPACPPPVPI
jgi:uncharacterized protein